MNRIQQKAQKTDGTNGNNGKDGSLSADFAFPFLPSFPFVPLSRYRFIVAKFLMLGVFLAFGQPIAAQEAHHQHTQSAKSSEPAAANRLTIPNVLVRDQFGNETRFPDLLKDKTVAVNFVFTTCTTICPPMGANFAQLRRLLGARAGKDVRLISVSVDPVTDTPQRLKTWSEKFNASEGWTLLTGAKSDVDALLKAFGVFTADKWDHSPTALIGHAGSGGA
jgi:protein SCO1/2